MPETSELPSGFSSQKRSILLRLKREGPLSLGRIAEVLQISKVATLRHLTGLETAGLIVRSRRVEGIGRPRAYFQLSMRSAPLFPAAYTHMSICALRFIEDRLGRDAVVTLLQQRAHEIHDENRTKFVDKGLTARVETLAQIRDEGGYMAEVGSRRKRSIELLEHNCPILAVAAQYPEACSVERAMFESLLDADVTVGHRVVAGDPVCRFIIRPKGAGT
jgi:predicted ArsR family transcriptional regulator